MITVRNLTKRYGDVVAVNDVSFKIAKGEVVGFLGPNGAGKSTTMRIITGFIGADSGVVEIDGRSIAADPTLAKSKIGYLPENNPLYEDMTVVAYLDFVGEMRGLEPAARAAAIRRCVGLYGLREVAAKDIGELSKGYRQRVGLAQAALSDPPILILDEPTSGLDPNQIVEIRNLIKEIGAARTVVLSTHNLAEVEATCSRVLIISGGRMVADDTPRALQERAAAEMLHVRVRGAGDIAAGLGRAAGVRRVRADGHEPDDWRRYTLAVDAAADAAVHVFDACVANGWKLSELRKEETKLEDVFAQLTRG
jgi:ABC-2 type transport system ATP-binding protein